VKEGNREDSRYQENCKQAGAESRETGQTPTHQIYSKDRRQLRVFRNPLCARVRSNELSLERGLFERSSTKDSLNPVDEAIAKRLGQRLMPMAEQSGR
jgi:hypothetical protein